MTKTDNPNASGGAAAVVAAQADGPRGVDAPSVEARAVVGERAVLRRMERRRAWGSIASNGTIAAAVMVAAAVVAVFVANSPTAEAVHHALQMPVGITLGGWAPTLTFEQFVNDFLMAIFFLLVGIELKFEMCAGELRHVRQAALPMLAAVGGVCVPSLIYTLVNLGDGGVAAGWAVPMATDIAFALGIMSLLGSRVAPATKVFFSTLAIADDVLAIVVIAAFYGQTPSVPWVVASLVCVGALALLHTRRVYEVAPYLVVGLVLWACMFNSGIHATLAGVIVALFLPAGSEVRLPSLPAWLAGAAKSLGRTYDEDVHILGQHEFASAAAGVERVVRHAVPPLHRVECAIGTAVNFGILPLFAFVNAQVGMQGASLMQVAASPVARGAFLGAFLGKPLGIIGVTFVLVRLGFAKLPKGMDWTQVVAVGLLGGLGFTMSILISGLAFTSDANVLAAKCAILAGSVASAVAGTLYLLIATRRR